MSKLENYLKFKNDYKNILDNDFNDIMTELGSLLKVQYPDLEVVAFMGYTPGWNDGETCEHTSYILSYEVSDYDEIREHLGDEDSEDEVYCYNSELSEEEGDRISTMMKEFEQLVEHKLSTDYLVIIDVREDVNVMVTDYSCGY